MTRVARFGIGSVAAGLAVIALAWVFAVALPWDDVYEQSYGLIEFPHGDIDVTVDITGRGDVRYRLVEIVSLSSGRALRDLECPCGAVCTHESRVLERNRAHRFIWDGQDSACGVAAGGEYRARIRLEDGTTIEGRQFHYGPWN